MYVLLFLNIYGFSLFHLKIQLITILQSYFKKVIKFQQKNFFF